MLGAQVWPGPPDKKQLGFDFIPVAVGGLWGRGRRLSRAVTAPSFEMHLLLGLCFFECSSDILRIQGLEGRRGNSRHEPLHKHPESCQVSGRRSCGAEGFWKKVVEVDHREASQACPEGAEGPASGVLGSP